MIRFVISVSLCDLLMNGISNNTKDVLWSKNNVTAIPYYVLTLT